MTRFSQGTAQRADSPDESQRLASWYTPGLSDPIGDRLLMFDNTTSSSLEMLRFKPEFAKAPGFEDALRRRADKLGTFRHPGIAGVRGITSLGDEDGLTLISNHTDGRRLSEVQQQAQGPQFAAELVMQLVPVLAALQEHEGGVAHGLLTAERVIVTPEGRLVLVEHVIAPAIDALQLPAERLWSELGLVTLPGAPRVDDPRLDVLQVGCLALSLLVGRRVSSLDAARAIVGGWAGQSLGPGRDVPSYLQRWLARALDVDGTAFESAREAELCLIEWPDAQLGPEESTPRKIPASASTNGPIVISASFSANAGSASRPSVTEPRDDLHFDGEFVSELDEALAEPVIVRSGPEPVDGKGPISMRLDARAIPTTQHGPEGGLGELRARAQESHPPPAPRREWLVSGLAVLCVVEAAIISTLLANWPSPNGTGIVSTAQAAVLSPAERTAPATVTPVVTPADGQLDIASEPAGARISIDGRPAGTTPLSTSLAPGEHTVAISNGSSSTQRTVNIARGSTATLMVTLTPAGATGGWLTVDTPLDLQVFEGPSLVGTTKAARLMLPSGRHQLRLASAALDFETALTVDIQAGGTVTARVPAPNTLISLNALPWANVFLDGRMLGTTPIANMSVPIGSHEVIWRHPQLGERRQTIVVTAKAPMRLVVDLRN